MIIAVLIAVAVAAILYFRSMEKKTIVVEPLPEAEKEILQRYVLFYQQLSSPEKTRFEEMVSRFLAKVRITGVKVVVEEIDRVFIAAGAIIPIFAFKNWEYTNIHEVLLYPDSFTNDYQIDGPNRNTMGMVGNGPMKYVMILSQADLRNGFLNHADRSNTAIHEFVHLVDKTDGDTDGLPAALLAHRYAVPWLSRIHQEIKLIQSGKSDINPYAATNEAEFLAVAAEYFFEKPHLMEEKHPELYALLTQIFTPLL
jgi:Mlc titration factor MtfA (ptsG expression regulator)